MKITDKKSAKNQSKALQKALNVEKSQGGALRRLKQIDRDFKEFNLSEFQKALLSNQNVYFGCIKHVYTKAQKRKVEQITRIKEEKELLTNTRYNVLYENNGTEFTLKTFGTREKAKECIKGLSLKKVRIEETETEVSTDFTPKEMLKRLQKIERAFYEEFTASKHQKTVTIHKVKRALDMKITDKDKELTKKSKERLKKAS